jgi:hypothetical protein
MQQKTSPSRLGRCLQRSSRSENAGLSASLRTRHTCVLTSHANNTYSCTQIYTWPDATLGELADLVRAVPPARDRPGARLSFSLVYPDRNGKATLRPIGTVFAKPVSRGGEDERKTLHSVRFQTGDYLDVGILDFRA